MTTGRANEAVAMSGGGTPETNPPDRVAPRETGPMEAWLSDDPERYADGWQGADDDPTDEGVE